MNKYIKTPERREQLLTIACDFAEKTHFRQVRRHQLAEAAGTATGNVSRVLGNMEEMRTDLIVFAIEKGRMTIIAQAIIDKHPAVKNLDEKVKVAALNSMV